MNCFPHRSSRFPWCILLALMVHSASATPLYWSGNGTTQGDTGVWDTTSSRWGIASSGPYQFNWNNASNDTASFGGDVAGTVTLGTGINLGGMQFDTAGYTVTGNTLTLGSGGNITANQAATISSSLAGSAAIAKSGVGTLTLNPSTAHTFNGGLNLNGGMLLADFANLPTPTNLILSGNSIGLGGGGLSLKGKSTGTSSQTLGAITVNAGGGQILGNKNGGTALNITLGAINAATTGGSLLVGNATAGNSPVITTPTGKDATGIHSGRIVCFTGTANTGYDWATTASASSPYTLSAYSAYTTLPTSAGSSTVNYNAIVSTTLTSGFSANTLKFAPGATASQNLNLGAQTLTLQSGGLLITGTGVTTTISNGTITAGNGSGSYDLIVHQYNNAGGLLNGQTASNTAISAVIADNSGTAVSLVKSGSGSLALTGNNTYTGPTYINAGNLVLGNGLATGTLGGGTYSGNISVAAGANLCVYLTTAQTLSGIIGGEGGLIKCFNGNLTLGNNNTYTGKTWLNAITAGGGGGTLSVTSFNSVNGGKPPLAGSSLGRPTTMANGIIDLGGAAQAGGTLKYTGSGETTDRVINFIFNGNGAGKTIDTSGTGLLMFTSNFTANIGSNDLSFTGTGGGEMVGGLPFTFANFTKSLAGTWTFGGSINTGSSAGTTSISAGTLVLRKGGFNNTGAMTVSANAGLIYDASTNTPMTIAGSLAITGGTSTTLGASIGSALDSARISVAGNATTTAAAIRVNLYGNSYSTVGDASGTYTLIQGGGTNTLNNATYSAGTVYNATNFIVGTINKAANAVTVNVTQVTPLTAAHWKGTATANLTKVWAASNGSSDGNWSAAAGGSVQSLVPGVNADVFISSTSPTVAPTNTTLGSDMSVKSLTIADTTNGLSLNASVMDSYSLTLGTGGIAMNPGVPTSTIAVPVVLGGNQTWTNQSTNPLTVSGVVSGTGNLEKAGPGTVTLSGFNSFTGNVKVSAGTLTLSQPTLPTSAIVTVTSGAMLQLNYLGTAPVSYLILNGVSVPAGVYNSTNASPYLTGTGSITVTITDTDVDGIPDWWMTQYFGHPTGQAGDLSRAQDDADSDGLNTLREYQLGTDPKKSDTDNDGLTDGAEVDTHYTNPLLADTDGDTLTDGAEVNTYHTSPLLTDTDADGLSDGDEVNIYATNPLSADTDNDGAGDWYEIKASFTDPKIATSKPNIPYPLPTPDNTPTVTNKPVKVFIISGQSNMEGKGDINPITTKGTLAKIVRQQNEFPNLLDTNGNWSVRTDVKYRGVVSAIGNANLTIGQGTSSTLIGPELGFGHVMGYHFDEPVIVLKASLGGQDLGYDFLPPGSQRYTLNGRTYAGYLDTARSWLEGSTPPPQHVPGATSTYLGNPVGGADNYAGKMFDDCVSSVNSILSNFATQYPQYAAQGYQVAGLGWFQGYNDSVTTPLMDRYEGNLVNFISAYRSALNAPNAPFVVAACGFDGAAAAGGQLTVIQAQLAVGNPVNYPAFVGNVKVMDTRPYWRTVAESPINQGYHYNHNSETYMLVGDAMGRGMIDLLGTATSGYASWASGPFQSTLSNSTASFDFDSGGLETGIEWVVGGDPTKSSDDAGLTPTLNNTDPNNAIFTFRRRDTANADAKTTITVEYGSSLALNSWTTASHGVNGVTIDASAVPATGFHTVVVSIPKTLASGGKLFARLRVVMAP